MIRWQKKRANKFSRLIYGVFVSYWLEFLIHIHSSPRVLHILNCSLLSEDVLPLWELILQLNKEDAWWWKDFNSWKDVLALFQPKVSIAFEKYSQFFFSESHTSVEMLPKRVTRWLAARFECRFILKTEQQNRILIKFQVSFARIVFKGANLCSVYVIVPEILDSWRLGV